MFREMRKKEREISEERARKILEQGDYGVLSVTGAEGYAYGVPLNYALVGDVLYFHCAKEGYKLDSIAENPQVSFCVVSKAQNLPEQFSMSYESAIGFGTIDTVEGEEKEAALFHLIEKYSSDYLEKGRNYVEKSGQRTAVLKLTLEHISGKAGH